MELLFDECVNHDLADHFQPHQVAFVEDIGWKGLKNGKLLERAQHEFDVLITVDSNLYHQNIVAQFAIAVIVLRGWRISYQALIGLLPETLAALDAIKPGEVVYVYADEKLEASDRRRGKGPFKEIS